jgi:hypothetical protein
MAMRKKDSNHVTTTVQKIGEQASSIVQTIADQAVDTAAASAYRAKGLTQSVTAAGKDQFAARPDLHEPIAELQHKVTDEVIPTLRDVALQAASLAVELWETGRERANLVTEASGHDYASQAAHLKDEAIKRAAEVRDEATKRAVEARDEASKRALDAKDAGARRASDASAVVADRASKVSGRAKSASKHAATTTVDTTKDTGALVFWLGAASAVVYFAFLDKKRRDQVLKFASDAMHGVKGSVDDMRSKEPMKFTEAA